MFKKELIVPFLVTGLTILFAGICIAVFFTNGKSPKWIARKMKIGGLLLTLTAVACNESGGAAPEIMCYDVMSVNEIGINTNQGNGIEVKLDTGNVLFGAIYNRQSENFSFSIANTNDVEFQKGEILPLDGVMDQSTEEFELELNKELQPGAYLISLFDVEVNMQETASPRNQVNLTITDE